MTVERDGTAWLSLLEELVNTDSAPGDHTGIEAVYSRLVPVLDRLGLSVRQRATDGGPSVLVARRSGSRTHRSRVLMVGHVDTVFDRGTAQARPFRMAGERAFGPGVADMKGGLVVMLAALSELGEDAWDGLDLTMVFNGDEESGSPFSRPVIEEMATGRDAALVFEAARPSGAVVTSRRGVARYRLDVTGRASHSGSNPGAGANALETLAHKILGIQQLGRDVDRATVNVVLADGGTRPNIIPPVASVHVDARFDDEAERTVERGLQALAGPGPVEGTTTQVTRYGGRPAFPRPFDWLAGEYVDAAKTLGLRIETVAAGGVSDANFTAALGVPTLDGLGPSGGGAHTDDEYIEVASLAERASACAVLLSRLARPRAAPGDQR
ncbi:M20 family metallopeptidase [Phytoactinopolyspora halotolerans]|uniref:M20 family metallopeptidase n=1 Tax=Phytoactinopolyspora halotolerans TaxID=1981512 RepID=A0A6L9SIX9_9ACTN|nr:M20 family metallopeptidase [Phytoactinopolyspora halotolerans]NEE04638.1 M20 family metallopeptidase [Phytoactinopolyspora halotolerans]